MTTAIWRLAGLTGSTPGYLHHAEGRVRLELETAAEEFTTVFDVEVSGITEVTWPRLQFSGGCSFVVAGETYRLAFLQPTNTSFPSSSAGATAITTISSGRSAGKAWRALLG